MNATQTWSAGIDVGGTYVDVVLVSAAGQMQRFKISRAVADPAESVLAAFDTALAQAGIAPGAMTAISHGSTLVTNLLSEQTAPPVAIITNRGFADVLTIARQNRAELYTLAPAPQTPIALFPADLRFELSGRMTADGHVAEKLVEAELADLADTLAASGVEAVAICLLHATCNPAQELAVAEAIGAACPGLALSLSHQIDVAPGEFERFLATALDAYVKPATRRYLDALQAGLQARGLPRPALVLSDASLRHPEQALAVPLRLGLAGPAAAMSGFHLHGQSLQGDRACISIETGGTTTDIGLIGPDGIVCGRKVTLGGMQISLRATDILSVAVGGGSVVSVNAAGALRLGPHSMGSLPGPAAFGKGGTSPTLTDALVLLDRLPERLAGGLVLDRAAAVAVMTPIAQALGCALKDAAEAVVATAATMIAEGVKAHAYRHGIDPTRAKLIAGGGGGPQHAAEVAALIGSADVAILPDAAVISALGCLSAPAMDALECALDVGLDAPGWAGLEVAAAKITAQAGTADIVWSVEAVYQGQSAALEIPFDPERDDAQALAARFDAAHAAVRGHAFDRPRRVQRLRGQWVTQDAILSTPPAPETRDTGNTQGPAPLFTDTTSIWIPAGWVCLAKAAGLELRRSATLHSLEGAA